MIHLALILVVRKISVNDERTRSARFHHFIKSNSSTFTDDRFLYNRRIIAIASANSAAAIVITKMMMTCPNVR